MNRCLLLALALCLLVSGCGGDPPPDLVTTQVAVEKAAVAAFAADVSAATEEPIEYEEKCMEKCLDTLSMNMNGSVPETTSLI